MNTLILGLALCSPTIDADAVKAAQQRGVPWVAILNGADMNQFGDHEVKDPPIKWPAEKHPPRLTASPARVLKAAKASQARRARMSASARQRAAYRAWQQRQAYARQRAYLQRIRRLQGW